jgi:L-rhamnose mutarotase
MGDPDRDMTERAVYVQHIDPEYREEYIEAHGDVPDGVTEAMKRGGVTSFELYVKGTVAICILEVESIEAYNETMSNDPEVEEWERYVAQYKREGVDVDADKGEQIPYAERVWSFGHE